MVVSWHVWHQTKKSSCLGPLSCRVPYYRVLSCHTCELSFRPTALYNNVISCDKSPYLLTNPATTDNYIKPHYVITLEKQKNVSGLTKVTVSKLIKAATRQWLLLPLHTV